MKLRAQLFAASAAPCLLCAFPASAQVFGDEIVVTAQKREQSAQDVGIAITAFTGDQVDQLGFQDTVDIVTQTPGMSLQQFHPSITVFNIRGSSQTDFADQHEPPVAVYVDEAYVGAMGAIHGQLYDIERVEVLKGPQGTLFGRNATGGLVHYISRKPTEEFEGYAELTYGSFDQIRSEAAISGPIAPGILGRLSFSSNNHDGYFKNRIGDDLLGADRFALRGQLLFQLPDDAEILLKGHYSRYDELGNTYSLTPAIADAQGLAIPVPSDQDPYGTCNGCGLTPFVEPDNDVFTGSIDDTGYFDKEVIGGTAKITWPLNDAVTLTSISDYYTMDKLYKEDADASPFEFFEFDTIQDLSAFSQELRLNGETEKLNWVAGGYYLNMSTENESGIVIDGGFLGFGPIGTFAIARNFFTLDTKSAAVFAQGELELSPQFSVIAGLRYTHDKKTMDSFINDELSLPPPSAFVFNTSVTPLASQKFDNFAAKFELDWRLADGVLLYAGYNRGHKAGSFAAPVFAPLDSMGNVDPSLLPHDQEVLTSYEAGFKISAADGRVRLNGSAFYYDYDDYQAFFLQNLTQAIFNRDARVYGGEIDLTWVTPVDGLEFLFGASFNDSKVMNISLPNGDVVDREMPQSPSFTANGLMHYERPFAGGTLAVNADFNYSGSFYFSVLNGPAELEDDYIVGNANVSFMPNDHWKISAFVKNISDTRYRVFNLDVSAIAIIQDVYAPPRWWGVSLGYSW